jgi:hypothetical protein
MKSIYLALALLCATGLILAGCGGDDDEEETQTLEFVSVTNPENEVEIDNGKPGESEGDQFGFDDDLQEGGESVGTVTGLCTVLSRAGGPCDITLETDQGRLAVQGLLDFEAETFEGPVVGGTGDYAGASGTLTADITQGRETPITVEITTEDGED